MSAEPLKNKNALLQSLGVTSKRLEEDLGNVFKLAKTPESKDGKHSKEHTVQIGTRTYVFHTWKLDDATINHVTIREGGRAETIRFFNDGTFAITEGEREDAGNTRVLFSSHGNSLSQVDDDDIENALAKMSAYQRDIGPWVEAEASDRHLTRKRIDAIVPGVLDQ